MRNELLKDDISMFRDKCVTVFDGCNENHKSTLEEMYKILDSDDDCGSITANMVGSDIRLAIIDTEVNCRRVLLSPVIIRKFGKSRVATERTINFEDGFYVKRFERVVVVYKDLEGIKHTETFTGLTAQAIQHSVDLLDGLLPFYMSK